MKKKHNPCEICSFRNPRATATALIIRNKKILLAKRLHAPFKGVWDLPGGYMNEKETPEQTMRREIKEELGVSPTELRFLNFFPGFAYWKGEKFPILSLVFKVTLPQKTLTKSEENSALQWFSKKELPRKIAFDSNNVILQYAKRRGLI